MKKKWLSFYSIGFSLFLVLLIIVIGFFLPKDSDLTETISPEEDILIASPERSDWSRYQNQKYEFSVDFPNSLTLGNFAEGEAHIFIFQSTRETRDGFQIMVSQLDEPLELTPETIAKDIPDLRIENPKKILLDNQGRGIMFTSDNESFGGNSREIWFVYHNFLYQVSSYGEFAPQLEAIINTWTFTL